MEWTAPILPEASKQGTTQYSGISFINTAHTGDSARTRSLKQVRSHVAKDLHFRKRQKEGVSRRSTRLDGRNGPTQLPNTPVSQGEPAKLVVDGGTPLSGRKLQVLRPKQPATAGSIDPLSRYPHPVNAVSTNRRNPFFDCSRPLSGLEQGLVDHYVTHSVDHDYPDCDHENMDPLFHDKLKKIWFPWAVAHGILIDGLVLTACRGLSTLYPNNPSYRTMALSCRGRLLYAAQSAIRKETGSPSDLTIALIFILASEDFISGNLEGWRAHGGALLKILAQKGANTQIGPEGFVGFPAAGSVYNPKYRLVNGPYWGQLKEGEW